MLDETHDIALVHFDLDDFGAEFTGVVRVEPEPLALSAAMDSVNTMCIPGPTNLPALKRLTWQSLARTVSDFKK